MKGVVITYKRHFINGIPKPDYFNNFGLPINVYNFRSEFNIELVNLNLFLFLKRSISNFEVVNPSIALFTTL